MTSYKALPLADDEDSAPAGIAIARRYPVVVSSWPFQPWRSGICIIAFAALLFSISTLGVKLLTQNAAIPALQVAAIPAAVCLLGTSLLVRGRGLQLLASSNPANWLTLSRGLLGAGSLVLYYVSIELLPLKDAVTLFFCSPVIATVLEFVVQGDSLNVLTGGGILSTVLGVFLVTKPDCIQHLVIHNNSHTLGMVVATAAAACNAGAFVIVRLLRGRQSALVLTWWYHLIVLGVTLTPMLASYPAKAVIPTCHQLMLLAGISACQFAGQLMLNRGFQLLSATRGSAINVLQVLFSYIWELTILHEHVDMMSAAGGGLVMAGVVAVALGGTPQEEAQTLAAETSQQQEQLVTTDSAGVQYVLVRSSLDIEAAPAGAAGHNTPHSSLLHSNKAGSTPGANGGARMNSKAEIADVKQVAQASLLPVAEAGRQVQRRSNAGAQQEADHISWLASAPQAIATRQHQRGTQQASTSSRDEGGHATHRDAVGGSDASPSSSASSTGMSLASSAGTVEPDMCVVCRPVPALTHGQAVPAKHSLDRDKGESNEQL